MSEPIDFEAIEPHLQQRLPDWIVSYQDLWFWIEEYIKDWLPLGHDPEVLEHFVLYYAKQQAKENES